MIECNAGALYFLLMLKNQSVFECEPKVIMQNKQPKWESKISNRKLKHHLVIVFGRFNFLFVTLVWGFEIEFRKFRS